MFAATKLMVVNLVSSPGAGKTTLLERTIRDLKGEMRIGVIEGDQQTDRDAKRIAATGVPVHQINTMDACHLDAHMIQHALDTFALQELDLLFIENVGNLICPGAFDLGEDFRAVVLSTTEGEDKPIIYPGIFIGSQLALINKVDLLEDAAHAAVHVCGTSCHGPLRFARLRVAGLSEVYRVILRPLQPGQLSPGNGGMTMKKSIKGAILLHIGLCLLFGGAAYAQDNAPETYVYSTYSVCDLAKQDRSDEIYAQLDKPILDAAVADKSIISYGLYAHQTGGRWRRASFTSGPSCRRYWMRRRRWLTQADATNKKLGQEYSSICNAHDDYIWQRTAGTAGSVAPGGAVFSTYYVCGMSSVLER